MELLSPKAMYPPNSGKPRYALSARLKDETPDFAVGRFVLNLVNIE
jgi:hypothetical protein